jgi:NAD(P)H-dependent FMN reductase
MFKVAVIVGSNRRESANRRLAHALSKLGADRFAFCANRWPAALQWGSGADLAKSVTRFKVGESGGGGLVVRDAGA